MSGIYIHFPFCKKKCLYCAFYSTGNFQHYNSYLNTLLKEIDLRKNYLEDKTINTLYLGGGTPTLLKIQDIETIIQKLEKNFTFSSNLEFTIEGNPEQLTLDYICDLKKLGVNRVSIGIQSFNDKILKLIGRTHDAHQAHCAIENAISAGINNISIDLIYGIYDRTLSNWQEELQMVSQYALPHFSAYSLTVEENSLLERKIKAEKFPQPDDNQSINELQLLINFAQNFGYEHYEVSNFAQSGFKSQHNNHYWDGTPYLGLGPSAHSFDGNSRQWNCASIKEYCEAIAQGKAFFTTEHLTPTEQYNEYVLLRLRTSEGVSLQTLERKFGAESLQYFLKELSKIDTTLYRKSGDYIQITPQGIALTDAITAELFQTSDF